MPPTRYSSSAHAGFAVRPPADKIPTKTIVKLIFDTTFSIPPPTVLFRYGRRLDGFPNIAILTSFQAEKGQK